MEIKSDTRLWNLCLKGDKKAFEEIYKRFYPMLYAYGTKLVSDGDLIRDTIQNLFVKLIQNHHKLSPTDHVKGYLIKAFRNKLLDELDQQKNMDNISNYEETFSVENIFSTLFPQEDEEAIQEMKLMKAYNQLSTRQQEILYLYYVNDLNHEEIAQALAINYQSSKNLLFRSLAKLRDLYFS